MTPLFTNSLNADLDINFYSVYLQDNWSINNNFVVEAALYFDRMENELVSGETFTQDEFSPRIGMIYEPNEKHTLRLAAFRYLLPFVSQRIDPTEVAGISVFRNAPEGTLNDEINAVWEYETGHGLYSLGAFHQEQSLQQDTITPVTEVEQDGAQLGTDILLSSTFGLAANYRFFDNQNLTDPSIDRKEHLIILGLRHQRANGFSAGITQTFRKIEFEDTTRKDEDIPITDLDMMYEFSNKVARVGFQVTNIFDEQFNWVTDQFVFVGRNPAREFLVTGSMNF